MGTIQQMCRRKALQVLQTCSKKEKSALNHTARFLTVSTERAGFLGYLPGITMTTFEVEPLSQRQ